MPRILTIAVPFALLAGCAAEFEMAGAAPSADGGTPTTATDTSAEPPPTDTDDGLAEPPVWWSLDGSLALMGQGIEPLYSTLSVHLWSANLDLLCTLEVPVEGALSLTPPDTTAELVTWWSVDHGPGDSATDCGTWDAGTLSLGLGTYDTRLDPALDARELLGQDVFGLYLQLAPEEPVYVVGIAGTSDLLTGVTSTDVQPLPDDQYQLESLLVLAL
jgi:hypothetical protein